MRLIVTVGGLDSIVTLRTLELSQLSLLILQTIRRKISGRADEEKMITVRLCKALMVNCQNISFSDKWLFDWKKKLLSFCFYNNSYRKCSLQTLQGRMTNVEGREGRGGSVFGTTTILHRELPTATPYCDYWYSHTQQDSLNSHWLPLFLLSSDQLLTLSTYNLNTFPQHNNICHIGAEQQGKRRDKRGEERRQERRQERREKREPPSFVSPGWSLILSNLARPDYHRSHRI